MEVLLMALVVGMFVLGMLSALLWVAYHEGRPRDRRARGGGPPLPPGMPRPEPPPRR